MISSIDHIKDAFSLSGKKALITGGAKGLGASLAHAFAESGADVAVADLNDTGQTLSELSAYGGFYRGYTADISSPESVSCLAEQVDADFGCIDILVNNAGISAVCDFLDDENLSNWHRVLNTNLGGTALMTHTFGNRMRKAGKGGCIVNMSSVASEHVIRTQNMTWYSTSKAAINMFTRCCAYEFAQYDIRVNAIACGFTNTDLSNMIPPGQVDYLNDSIPLGRFNEPIEVGAMAVYLASPAAAQITGVVLSITGGQELSV